MTRLHTLISRLFAPFRGERLEQDLESELRTHLEMLVDENVRRGISAAEAHYAALRSFGGVEQVKESYRDQRGLPMIETLAQDVRYALRQLRRSPGFAAMAILTLALGLGANIAIFSVVHAVLLRSLPYKDPARLAKVWETYRQFPKVWASVPNFWDWQEQNHAFEAIGAYRIATGFTLTGQGEPQRTQGTFVSANLFGLLGVKASLGRTFVPAEDKRGAEPIVILSHALWQQVFGSNPSMVGRAITLNDKSYTVVGVMPPGIRFPDWADLWMPLGQMGTDELTSRVYHPLEVVARLKAGVTLAEAQAQMSTIAGRLDEEYPKTNAGWGVTLVPLRKELLGSAQEALLILLGATGLVLLIACANVANLLLARASARGKEMALRAVLGAGRGRLMRQLLTESALLSSLGGTLGLLLAFWGRDALVRIGPAIVPHLEGAAISGPVLAFSAVISILTGLVFGLVPAFQSSRLDLNGALKEGARTSPSHRHNRLRSCFVVVQVALALILVVGAGLLIKSFVRLLGVDPGFSPRNVLTARIDLSPSRYPSPDQFYEHVSDRLRALPGVEAVGLINYFPLGPESANKTRFGLERSSPSTQGTLPVAELRLINLDYFRAMGIPLVKGRNFRSWGEEKQQVIIINTTMAHRIFPNEDPVGRRINLGAEGPQPSWFSIVGVVGDVRDFGLASQPQLDIYLDGPDSGMCMVVRTDSDPLSLAPSLRRVVHDLDREVPVTQVITGEQIVSHSLASRRFSMVLLGLFAGLALMLAAIGIYGVISYAVTQRTHEIGIRMALGAERGEVLKLVVGQGLALAFVGVAIGLAGAFALSRLLAGLLYAVKPTDPATFAVVSLVLTAVALLASYIPARRATKVDPMVALRYE
ncbi:MAG TPA: ABC transporter permease [Terriglobia bacterium]